MAGEGRFIQEQQLAVEHDPCSPQRGTRRGHMRAHTAAHIEGEVDEGAPTLEEDEAPALSHESTGLIALQHEPVQAVELRGQYCRLDDRRSR